MSSQQLDDHHIYTKLWSKLWAKGQYPEDFHIQDTVNVPDLEDPNLTRQFTFSYLDFPQISNTSEQEDEEEMGEEDEDLFPEALVIREDYRYLHNQVQVKFRQYKSKKSPSAKSREALSLLVNLDKVTSGNLHGVPSFANFTTRQNLFSVLRAL